MHRCTTTAYAEGLGVAANCGVKEIYTEVRIEDLETAVKDNATYVEGTSKVATVKDVKAYNVDGGAATTASWLTRDLNTISDPSNIGLSVSANVITVPAGTYSIRWSAPAWRVRQFTSKVEYSTDSTFATGVTSVQGSNSFASNASSDGTQSQTLTIGTLASVTFTETTYVRIRQWNKVAKDPAEGETSNALGVATLVSGAGDAVYTIVEIEDLATAVKNDGTSSIVKQIKHASGPSAQTSYNSGTWTTIVQESITLTTSHNVLIDVKAGFYGGSEDTAYNGGRLLRTTSSTDTSLWEYSSIWGRVNSGSGFKASIDGPTVVDTPGVGTHTYQWQTQQHDASGTNDVLVPANGNSITLTEYT